MLNQPLPAFSNVVASGVATLEVPSYDLSLLRVVLQLGGTALTKAMLTDIKVRIGARTVWQCSGSDLDLINKYKGIYDNANFLTIDFTERDQPDVQVREAGAYSLPLLRQIGKLTIEVTIAGATAPTLSAVGFFSAPQNFPNIAKVIKLVNPSAPGGRFQVPLQFSGALVKRLFILYTGTDWGASTNGNVERVELKKNGLVIHDQTCRSVRFVQQEYRKVPQAKAYVVDFIVDNNFRGHLRTDDVKSLELNTYLTATDSPTVLAEVLDPPNNL
jgi:hypothetical protein